MLSRRDQGLLVDLVRQAAVAIRARLLAAELQASRERLVLGREDDRRRIRRDLHDGLGPVLGGVALRLQAAGNAIDADPARARELVAAGPHRGAATPSTTYAASCTTCARPRSTTSACEAAVRQQADRVRSEVDVDVTAEGATGLPAAVEVAAYRIVSEALANVVKHARREPRRRTPRGRRGRADRHRRRRRPGHRSRRHRRGRPAVAARARRGARRPLRGGVPGVRRHHRPRGPAVRRRRGDAVPTDPRPPRRACAGPNP